MPLDDAVRGISLRDAVQRNGRAAFDERDAIRTHKQAAAADLGMRDCSIDIDVRHHHIGAPRRERQRARPAEPQPRLQRELFLREAGARRDQDAVGTRAAEALGDVGVHIVRKALAKQPERRYPSVEALALDLRRFLEEGDKVKVNIRFRGREMSHQELGREMASRIETDLGEDIVIESRPRLEGRQMVMMIAPKKR